MIAATPEAVAAREVGTQLAEFGRVLATQNDWRAILFVALGIIVFLGGLMVWERIASARRDNRVAEALTSIAKSLTDLTVEVKVMSAVTKRKGRDGNP